MLMWDKQAFCGEGRIYNSPISTVREARLQNKKETNFCRKKLRIKKVFHIHWIFNQGRRVASI